MDQTTYRLRRRSLLVVSIVLMASLLAPAGSEAGASGTGSGSTEGASTESSWACVGGNLIGHSHPYLTGFTVVSPASPFYAARETAGSANVTITVTAGDICTQDVDSGQGHYVTSHGSAQAVDYASQNAWSQQLCNNIHPDKVNCIPQNAPKEQVVSVGINDDGTAEAAVESFLFEIDQGRPYPPSPSHFTEAPVHIIDDEGSARVSLEPTLNGGSTKAYARGEPSIVDIPVFWAGSGTPGNVSYSVEPGSPAPTEGVDYRVDSPNPLPASAFNRADDRLGFIRIRILNNAGSDGKPAKELDEVINVTLQAGAGYTVEGGKGSTTLTILDGGSDTLAPRTRFHHPKHKKKYRRNAYQLREMHIFYREPGGSGIQKVQLAIQRKLKSGKCQWWNGKRFKRGRCKKPPGRFWKKAKYDRFLDWYLYRVPAFKPTVRTNIRYYRAFARGFDHAGNVETRFQKKRNKNKFWIKRR